MKRLDELGVSPAPWQAILHREKPIAFVVSRDIGDDVVETCQSQPSMCNADAELIAAAPDLYEALREAVVEMCHNCPLSADGGDRCNDPDNGCFVKDWRKALEKAGCASPFRTRLTSTSRPGRRRGTSRRKGKPGERDS